MHACSIDCRKGVARGGTPKNEKMAGQQVDVEGVFNMVFFLFAYSKFVLSLHFPFSLSCRLATARQPQTAGSRNTNTSSLARGVVESGWSIRRKDRQNGSCIVPVLSTVVSSTADDDNRKTRIQTSLDMAHTYVLVFGFVVVLRVWLCCTNEGEPFQPQTGLPWLLSLVPCLSRVPACVLCFRVPWVRLRRNTGYVALPYISDLQRLGRARSGRFFNLLVGRAKRRIQFGSWQEGCLLDCSLLVGSFVCLCSLLL